MSANTARPGATRTGDAPPSGRGWLVSLLGRDPRLSARFSAIYARLHTLSTARKRLLRRAAGTLAGAALLLALGGMPAHAATITVANGAVVVDPNGVCSLSEAIANANDTTNGRPHADCAAGDPGGPDTINLPSGGMFVVDQIDNNLYGATGLPVVESALTIVGNGATIQRAGTEPFRLLAVAGSGDLTLESVTVKNGFLDYDYGGAVLAYGDLTIRDSTFSGNEAYGGGAIFAYDIQVTISGSQFEDNTANTGGGLSLQYSTATISQSTISGGQGPSGWGGGGIYLLGSEASVSDTTIVDNSNAGGGGGFKAANTTLSLSDSVVADNNGFASYGGGLYFYNSQVNLIRTTISGNNAAKGAGIYLYDGLLTLKQSLVAGNEGNLGGGILNGRGTVAVINTTLSGNSAANGGGAANLGVMTLDNVTITGNRATGNGGGLLNQGSQATTTLRRSLIAGNTGGQGREIFHSGQSISAGHYNLLGFNGSNGAAGFTPGGTSFTPAGGLAGIIVPSLADNGGPTRSHLLPADSPAIDRSPSADCFAGLLGGVDQRGQPRNRDADDNVTANECDIGAIEAPGTLAPVWAVYIPSVGR